MQELAAWFATTCVRTTQPQLLEPGEVLSKDTLKRFVPDGYSIVPGTVHSRGKRDGDLNAPIATISVTGSMEGDLDGNHPYLTVIFGDDGKAGRCDLVWKASHDPDETRNNALSQLMAERSYTLPTLAYTLAGILSSPPPAMDFEFDGKLSLNSQKMQLFGENGWADAIILFDIEKNKSELRINMAM